MSHTPPPPPPPPPTPPPPIIHVSGHFTVQPGFDRSLVGMTGPVTLIHVDSQGQSTSPAFAPRDIHIDSAAQQPDEAELAHPADQPPPDHDEAVSVDIELRKAAS